MGITTTKYIKKPLYVQAVRITRNNFDEVVKWCKGRIQTERADHPENPNKKYIKLQTHNPINTRQTKAFIGDWILKTDRGFKVYTHKAFLESFDEVKDNHVPQGGDRSVEAEAQAFAEAEEDLDSCVSPRTQLDPSVPH
jgi:hypothetical protein